MGTPKKKKSKKKNRTDIKRLLTVLGSAVLIVLVLIALVWFVSRFFHFSLFAGKSDENSAKTGVIYRISSDNVRSMTAFDNGLAVLTNSSVKYLDASGRELESNKHTYSDPVMKVFDKNVFLFDKGSTSYRVEKNTSVYAEQTAPGPILCGAVGKRGNYAFSVNNDAGFQSHIYVYSRNGKKQFEWGSASDYCSALALSDSGGRMAVAVLGTDNAEYYSRLLLFSFRSDTPVFSVDFSDEDIFNVDFVSSRKLAVYTDRGVYLVNGNGVSTPVLEYPSNELRFCDVNACGIRAVATAPYGNDQTPVLTVFNERNKLLYSRHYSGLISQVACGDSYLGVLLDGKIELLNRDNIAVGSVDPGEACSSFVLVNHSLYALTADGISRYNAHFDTQRSEADTLPVKNDETEAATQPPAIATATDGDAIVLPGLSDETTREEDTAAESPDLLPDEGTEDSEDSEGEEPDNEEEAEENLFG